MLHEKFGKNLQGSKTYLRPNRRDQFLTIRKDSVDFICQMDKDDDKEKEIIEINRITGCDSIRVCVMGSGNLNTPTGKITFKPPETKGWKMNGNGESAEFSEFTSPPIFVIFYDFVNLDVLVSHVNP